MLKRREDQTAIEEFATDESGSLQAAGVQAVLYPETEADVAQAVSLARQEGKLLTTSGGGTGITGGRVAANGGYVLSTADLCRPLPRDLPVIEREVFGRTYAVHVDEDAMEVFAPAGIPLEVLDDMLPEGLMYPPDPTEKSAFLGGTIVTNASGARTFYYGATRQWVLGLRVVLPTGEIVTVERGQVSAQGGELVVPCLSGTQYALPVPTYDMPDVKNAAGLFAAPDMDLVDLFVGSEGILGIVTEARLKLVQRPEGLIGQIAFFESEADALGFVADIRAASGQMTVLSIEYFDRDALDFMEHETYAGKGYTAVYTEICGDLEALEPLLNALEANNCSEDWFADTDADLQEQKQFRHSLPEGVNSYVRRHGSYKVGTDMAVPAGAFPEMLAKYHAAGNDLRARFPREGKHVLMFGHIGNFHLHVNFLTHGEEEREAALELYGGLAKDAVAFGGTISAEHGVGKKQVLVDGQRVPYLQVMLGREGLMQIARIKRALDPGMILDTGNMVPAEYVIQAGT